MNAAMNAVHCDLRFAIIGFPQRLYSNFIRGRPSLPVRIVD